MEESQLKQDLAFMFTELEKAVNELEKFEGGNASAGTRIRKSMQSIKSLAQDVRVEVQRIKNEK